MTFCYLRPLRIQHQSFYKNKTFSLLSINILIRERNERHENHKKDIWQMVTIWIIYRHLISFYHKPFFFNIYPYWTIYIFNPYNALGDQYYQVPLYHLSQNNLCVHLFVSRMYLKNVCRGNWYGGLMRPKYLFVKKKWEETFLHKIYLMLIKRWQGKGGQICHQHFRRELSHVNNHVFIVEEMCRWVYESMSLKYKY